MIALLVALVAALVISVRERHHAAYREQATIDLFAANEDARKARAIAESAMPTLTQGQDLVRQGHAAMREADARIEAQRVYLSRLRMMLEESLRRGSLPPEQAVVVVENARAMLGNPPV